MTKGRALFACLTLGGLLGAACAVNVDDARKHLEGAGMEVLELRGEQWSDVAPCSGGVYYEANRPDDGGRECGWMCCDFNGSCTKNPGACGE